MVGMPLGTRRNSYDFWACPLEAIGIYIIFGHPLNKSLKIRSNGLKNRMTKSSDKPYLKMSLCFCLLLTFV